MRKKNVWEASDGTEFTDQGECIRYERKEGFRHAVIQFIEEKLDVDPVQALELEAKSDILWALIRDNAEDFQAVLDLAKPRKMRGRPPAPKKAPAPAAAPAPDPVEEPKSRGFGGVFTSALNGKALDLNVNWLGGPPNKTSTWRGKK